MKHDTTFAQMISYVATAAKETKLKALGGVTAQYIYKIDDGDFHLKIAADLTPKKAIVTQTVVYGTDPPEVVTIELDYEKDAKVFPMNIGCPVDCYIYTFKEFNCPGERELKFFFSKTQVDYGEGPGYVIGVTEPNLEALQFIYPCTKT
ncbi:hypothetical protein LJR220_001774 [Bradyrhizobium sp. LjRoot220]|uniref:hypothetical protein n=1 Tax=Bradyrhizobium sp. LjRoot220 TaxID=3342284 RepID=UPI003ED0F2FA